MADSAFPNGVQAKETGRGHLVGEMAIATTRIVPLRCILSDTYPMRGQTSVTEREAKAISYPETTRLKP